MADRLPDRFKGRGAGSVVEVDGRPETGCGGHAHVPSDEGGAERIEERATGQVPEGIFVQNLFGSRAGLFVQLTLPLSH